MTEGKCAIWGTPATVSINNGVPEYDSPRAGGKYLLGPLYKEGISALQVETKLKLTSWLVDQRASGNLIPEFSNGYDFLEKINSRAFISISEKIERYFRFCSHSNIRPGRGIYAYKKSADRQSNIGLQSEEIFAWTECENYKEFIFFKHILSELGFINSYVETVGEPDFDILTAAGFARLEEIERRNVNSKLAFVAMWFDPSLNDTYENAIEPAIREAGYEPRIVRKVEHNNKIDDEIIAGIRQSKFVIADFTCGFSKEGSEAIARGGVYYEAGFAQGLGLPVIWTCREDIISHVHFDTRQYNHIVWKDTADLKEKLLNRIRATIT